MPFPLTLYFEHIAPLAIGNRIRFLLSAIVVIVE